MDRVISVTLRVVDWVPLNPTHCKKLYKTKIFLVLFFLLMARVFTLYDADGDGVISRSELRDVVMAIHRLSPHGKINDKDSIRIRGEEKKEKEKSLGLWALGASLYTNSLSSANVKRYSHGGWETPSRRQVTLHRKELLSTEEIATTWAVSGDQRTHTQHNHTLTVGREETQVSGSVYSPHYHTISNGQTRSRCSLLLLL